MTEVVHINSNHPLVGTWQPADDFSDVRITIEPGNDTFAVSAVDLSDSEEAEVSAIFFDGDYLEFSLYWSSTGRRVTHKFLCQSQDTVSSTYSYVGQEIWQRHET